MKIKEFCGKQKKKIIIISVSLIVVIVVAVGVAIYFVRRGNAMQNPFGQGGSGQAGFTGFAGFQGAEGMLSATGVISVGITEESFDVENLTTGLEIEEIYVASNDSVEAGTKVAKLSEESIAEAREELEQVLKEADLAYRAGAIAYEQNKINAKYDRDSTVLDGEQAKEVYDETIADLLSNLERAQEELTDAKEQIAEYESYVNNDSYRSYFKVDEYQAIYDETLQVLVDKMDEWGVSWSQITGGGMSGGSGVPGDSGIPGNSGDVRTSVSGGDSGLYSQYVSVLSSLYKVLEQHLQNLEQAQSDYEDAVANAAFELQTLQLKLPALEQAVLEAQQNYDTQVLQAKLTYETSLSNAEHADSDYETDLQKAESDYETLKSDWEDAKENLELFESTVGDGYFYASNSGTILRMMIREGRELTSESIVFMYSNPEEMTVTVSVDQTDIAQIALGDTAFVQSAGYGSFEGIVTELNPVSNSDSRTSVTYQVTVTLSGETGTIPANTSVTVIFGMAEGAMQPGGEMPQSGQRPGRGERPNHEEEGMAQ